MCEPLSFPGATNWARPSTTKDEVCSSVTCVGHLMPLVMTSAMTGLFPPLVSPQINVAAFDEDLAFAQHHTPQLIVTKCYD